MPNRYNNDFRKMTLSARRGIVFGGFAALFAVTILLVMLVTREPNDRAKETESNVKATEAETTTAPDTMPPETDAPIPPETTAEILPLPVTSIGELTPPETTSGEDAVSDGETILAKTEDAGKEYLDSIVFLGDSTTFGLKYYKALTPEQVWTPKSGTLTLSDANIVKIYNSETDSEMLIKDAVELKKPKFLVITLGVNGISFMDEKDFTESYRKLVENIRSVSPETEIILQSIFPVARSYKYQNSINNTKITAANGWVLSLAEELSLKYLDTQSILVDSEGYLPENLHNGDGLHLNEISAPMVTEYIRTHAHPKATAQ